VYARQESFIYSSILSYARHERDWGGIEQQAFDACRDVEREPKLASLDGELVYATATLLRTKDPFITLTKNAATCPVCAVLVLEM
jgi:hypothetical protein